MQPATDGDLIAALVCVARALVGLHAQGFVHRDIRWPNVLCLGNMYQVGGLIDVLQFHNRPQIELWKNLQNPNTEQRFTAEKTLKYLLDL